jgi:phosphoribosylcarboxyaminoimidazole (NCAIR) mutase
MAIGTLVAAAPIGNSYRTTNTDANAMDAIVKKMDTFIRSFWANERPDVADDLGSTRARSEKINVTFAQHSGKKRFTGNHAIHAKPIMGSPVSALKQAGRKRDVMYSMVANPKPIAVGLTRHFSRE